MKFKNKNWWKAMLIRAGKTFVQSILAGGVGVLFTDNWKIAIMTAVLTAVFSCLNSMVVNLPEVDPDITSAISPEIEDEEVIDTTEEDAELEGNLLGVKEGGEE